MDLYNLNKANKNFTTLGMQNKTGSVNGVRGDVRHNRIIQTRATSSLVYPSVNPFKGTDDVCINSSDLYNMLFICCRESDHVVSSPCQCLDVKHFCTGSSLSWPPVVTHRGLLES